MTAIMNYAKPPTQMILNKSKPPLFASIDVETDGDNPMRNSMRALGIVFIKDDGTFVDHFYVHVSPQPGASPNPRTMNQFWTRFPKQWEYMQQRTVTPIQAMEMLAKKLHTLQQQHSIRWIGKPSSVDFTWLKCYYETYGPDERPRIGHFCHCLNTLIILYCVWKNIGFTEKPALLGYLSQGAAYSHNALEDAHCQAIMYINLRRLIDLEKKSH